MKQNKLKISALGLVVLLSIALPSTGVFAASGSANTTINGTILAMISISTSGTVPISVTPTSSALMSSAKDTVTVTTNSAGGYTLYVKSSDATTSLTSGGNSIAPTSGTAASPTAMVVNKWGYRVDGQSGFGGGTTTALNSGTAAGIWAGITTADVSINIENAPVAAKQVGVWYAIYVDASQASGIYSDIVTYTAITK